LQKLWFLGALLLLGSASAYAGPCLQQVLRDLNEPLLSGYLSLKEEAEIRDWFSDTQLPEQIRAQGAFEDLMEARLRELPPEVRASVIRIKKGVITTYPADEIAQYERRQVHVFLPKEHWKTAVSYFIQVHELEHAIQVAMEAHLSAQAKDSLQYRTQVIHLTETGAMAAEYHYLKLIPAQEKRKLAKEILSHKGLKRRFRKHISRILLNSIDLTLPEYLAAERPPRAYTKGWILTDLIIEEGIQGFSDFLRNNPKKSILLPLIPAVTYASCVYLKMTPKYCAWLPGVDPTPDAR
jgi:hypothetical protein